MKPKPVLKFVRLSAAAHQLGARSVRGLVKDIRHLTDAQRREIADLLEQKS